LTSGKTQRALSDGFSSEKQRFAHVFRFKVRIEGGRRTRLLVEKIEK